MTRARRLVLVRHAKSSWKDPGATDFERTLHARGHRDAPVMGARLRARGVAPDVLVTSPAVRALATARILAREMGFPEAQIEPVERLYLAGTETLLDVIREFSEDASTAMLVGHNPGLTDLANLLTTSSFDNVPTTGVVEILYPDGLWTELVRQPVPLAQFDYPKKK